MKGDNLKPGDRLAYLYEITKRIGKGNTLYNYVVYRQDWEVELFLKIPRQSIVEEHLDTFKARINRWINLGQHPHLCTCEYVQLINDIPYVFSEFFKGKSLNKLIDKQIIYSRHPQKSLKTILDIAIQSAWALEYCHQHQVIHGHFKPSNIIVNKQLTIKITDIGLIPYLPKKAALSSLLLSCQTDNCQTWAYASPEQLNNASLSPQSDMWNWAATVLHLFTGKLTWNMGFIAPDILDEWLQTTHHPENLPKIPERLVVVLQHCFNFALSDRPKTMDNIIQQLMLIYLDELKTPYTREYPNSNNHHCANLCASHSISFLDHSILKEVSLLTASEIKQINQPCRIDLEKYNQHLQLAKHHLAQDKPAEALKQVTEARMLNEYRRANEAMDLWFQLYLFFPRTKLKGGWLKQQAQQQCSALMPSFHECYAITQSPSNFGLWHINTGHFLNIEHSAGKNRVVNMSLDGHYIVASNLKNEIMLWDNTLQQICQIFTGHGKAITCLALSQDTQYLLSGSVDKTIKLWHLASGCCLHTYQHHKQAIINVAFSADSLQAISMADEKLIIQWPLFKPQENLTTIAENTPSLMSASLNGEHVLFCISNKLWLWDIYKQCFTHTVETHEKITAICLDINGHYAAIGTQQGDVQVWNLGHRFCEKIFTAHKKEVTQVVINMDCRYLQSYDIEENHCQWVLDWQINALKYPDWDAILMSKLRFFLARHELIPETEIQTEIAEDKLALLLKNRIKTECSEKQLDQLMYQFACSGLGCLTKSEIRTQLALAKRKIPSKEEIKVFIEEKFHAFQAQRELKSSAKERNQIIANAREQRCNINSELEHVQYAKKKNEPWQMGMIPTKKQDFMGFIKFIVTLMILHDLFYYALWMATPLPKAIYEMHNSANAPDAPFADTDPAILGEITQRIEKRFIEQRRIASTFFYGKAPKHMLQPELNRLQYILNEVKDLLVLSYKIEKDDKHLKLRFYAEFKGKDGKIIAMPIELQQGPNFKFQYQPSFINRVAKQINNYQANMPADFLFVGPFLLSSHGRLWSSPR